MHGESRGRAARQPCRGRTLQLDIALCFNARFVPADRLGNVEVDPAACGRAHGLQRSTAIPTSPLLELEARLQLGGRLAGDRVGHVAEDAHHGSAARWS